MPRQETLFGLSERNGIHDIVNVATVPLRSPFRYPGGKTWLVPRIRQWLSIVHPTELIEPFAGGGIVSLTAVMEGFVEKAVFVEKDEGVAAVWRTILNGNAEWLANRIVRFDLTVENVRKELESTSGETRDLAFSTILRNRCFRGGILADGAGMMKQGENGKGLSSRWYPGTLRKRILAIAHYKERLQFIEGDGMEVISDSRDCRDVAFFIDPPYTKAGKRLYLHSEIDHDKLFRATAGLAGDFLMTYDNAPEILAFAERHGFSAELVAMKNTHNARQTELLIGRDLDWLQCS